MEHRQLNFDVARGSVQHRLFVRLGDLGSRTVVSRFHSRGEPVEVTDAEIRILRPDKTEILGACKVEDNTVTYTFTGGEDTEDTVCDLAVSGEYECEYILYGEGGAVMTSPRFIVTATDVLFGGEGAESSDSYKAYIAALMKLQTGNFTVSAESVSGDEVATAVVTVGTETIHIDLKVPRGKDGYTPVKGVDYFDGKDGVDGEDYVLTYEDKEEIAGMIPPPSHAVQTYYVDVVSGLFAADGGGPNDIEFDKASDELGGHFTNEYEAGSFQGVEFKGVYNGKVFPLSYEAWKFTGYDAETDTYFEGTHDGAVATFSVTENYMQSKFDAAVCGGAW